MAPGEKETKTASAGDTSAGTKSPKKEKPPIDPNVRLRILQQSIHDCQEAGFQFKVARVYDHGNSVLALMLPGIDFEKGNLVTHETKSE